MTEPLTHDRALANPNLYDETTPYKTIHRSSAKMSLFENISKLLFIILSGPCGGAAGGEGQRRGGARWKSLKQKPSVKRGALSDSFNISKKRVD
jgi:hypothetical protein